MKKLMTMVALVATTICANAAMVSWKYTGVAAEKDYSLFLFTEEVGSSFDSFADLTAGNVASATVAAKKVGPSTTYTATGVASSPSIVKGEPTTLWFVLVADSTATEYKYGSFDATASVYGEQDSVGSILATTSAGLTATGTIGGTPGPVVPEPTSGLLLLVGMAGLALRRKQK